MGASSASVALNATVPSILGRGRSSSCGIRRSQHLRKFVECTGKRQSAPRLDPEYVVPSPQVLDEGVPSDDDAGASVPFQAPHGPKPYLEPSMVSLDTVVAVLGGVVKCGRQEVRD